MYLRNHPVVARTAPFLLATLLFTCASGSTAFAQQVSNFPRPELWVVNNDVRCLALTPCTLYAGGYFTYVGPNTGPCAAISAAAGLHGSAVMSGRLGRLKFCL